MRTPLLSRSAESAQILRFIGSAADGPAGLVLEGDAGIGKTTLWLDCIERALERGFVVLSARAAQTESLMAYTSLADLLYGVDAGVLANLPEPQRVASIGHCWAARRTAAQRPNERLQPDSCRR